MKRILSLFLPLCILAIGSVVISNTSALASSTAHINTDLGDKLNQIGPPWLDPAWHYRRAVVVSNTGAALPYYQVLIKLDINNFDFSRTQEYGEDIRFAHSDGTTELKYWIESWDSTNHLAYLWVRVPSLAVGETTIYIYYGNPAAVSVSDGTGTFDEFDDNWDQFPGGGLDNVFIAPGAWTPGETSSPFDWTVLSGSPVASGGVLSLGDGTGIKSTASFQYQAVGMRANYGMNSTDEWIGFINGTSGPRTVVSDDKSGNANDLFLHDKANGIDHEYVVLPKIGGQDWHGAFHIYELRWKDGQSVVDVNHGLSSALSTWPDRVPNISLPVTLYNDTLTNSSLQVDWAYVRQYHDPEPAALVKGEQGLVELGIGIGDSPDPVRKGISLTYQLTISNTGSISAPGVVVTDTLPGNVVLLSAVPSQGTCEEGSVILCDLNIINSNSRASVTVIVSTTMEGTLTDIAAVGSPGYELDLSDNYSEEQTVSDWTLPVVNWERPVPNGDTFLTFGGMVTLEASATDIGGIGDVEFKLWDHIHNQWLSIGKSYAYPYQVQFDSSILAVNEIYQMFVIAVDKAGNQSNPYDPLQRIFMDRRLPVFIPLLRK